MIIQGVSLNGVTVIDMVTPTFVTSGLQLYLNASNSTSYPGTGTTWTDLSGNLNNGTLVNSPVYTEAQVILHLI